MRNLFFLIFLFFCSHLPAQQPMMYCTLDTTGHASFCVKNSKAGMIVVEYNLWGRWVKYDSVCNVNAGQDTCVTADYQLHHGLNQIRFFIDDGIASTYDVTSSSAKCTIIVSPYSCNILPKQTTTDIQLPRLTYYELYNEKGWMVKRGWASSLAKAGLANGTYKLCYENCTMEFVVNQ
jgi:hypothetical protein